MQDRDHRHRPASRVPEPPADAPGLPADRLLQLAYDDLRALARRYMQRERKDHTLQPTALVHEAYLRLNRLDRIAWKGRTHFLACAAGQMRYILVEHARAAKAQKRDRARTVRLSPDLIATETSGIDILALNEALETLEANDARMARVAEMRLIAGMTFDEIAQALKVSARTAKRDWRFARAWLQRALAPGDGSPGAP